MLSPPRPTLGGLETHGDELVSREEMDSSNLRDLHARGKQWRVPRVLVLREFEEYLERAPIKLYTAY